MLVHQRVNPEKSNPNNLNIKHPYPFFLKKLIMRKFPTKPWFHLGVLKILGWGD